MDHISRSIYFLQMKYFVRNWVTKFHLVVLGLIIINIIFLLPWRHSCEFSRYIYDDNIVYDLVRNANKNVDKPLCPTRPVEPCLPPFAGIPSEVNEDELETLPSRYGIRRGGHWSPRDCSPQFRVSVVVPYRNRPAQLSIFLFYMHHFLIRQKLNYTIYVVEQTHNHPFNRGKLFNIGYKEASRLNDENCFIFHDVDLLPEKCNNLYACSRQPRHLISALNTFRYNLPYCDLFGGAVAFTREQFDKVNGFANRFFGWGGEDDDLSDRVIDAKYNITRWDPTVARYIMLPHKKELANSDRYILMEGAKEQHKTDGLSSLKYYRLKLELRSLYTWILADL